MQLEDVLEFIDLNRNDVDAMMAIRKEANKQVKRLRDEVREDKMKTYDPEAIKIAEYIWEQVNGRYNFLKGPNIEKWAECIQTIPDKKRGIDYKVIMAVANWSQHNDFWRQQIRSGKNFKKHFNTLLIQIKERSDAEEIIHA